MTDPGNWLDMRRSDFDLDEPLTLFDAPDQSHMPRPPDRHGTQDLFTALEADDDAG